MIREALKPKSEDFSSATWRFLNHMALELKTSEIVLHDLFQSERRYVF